jgi:hypothetical protein
VVARKRRLLLCKIKVVIFQLIIKMPTANPTMAVLIAVTSPKYSGARNRESAPKVRIKFPVTVANKIYQKTRNTWYFRKCNRNNCKGIEYQNPVRYFFIFTRVNFG